ncbi:hypothetical protein MUN84_22480 (plasmid) [Hymenobacter sp. 5516J-16]|uniref:hypothetical protein n=1 Tax=Hymenobacter sp. 5516J-16 TaxID=2932253 RepID=UPI001FCFC110|nr:hypothetical protein [Hymenobacter sp. 5516J-16]UOQ79235.1 hypothetical protein MUN84_22480 [Hymenobacter sp. 5516J-16]
MADRQTLVVQAVYLDSFVDRNLVSSELIHPLFIRLRVLGYWTPGQRDSPPAYLTFYCPRAVYLAHKMKLGQPNDTLLVYFRPPYRIGSQGEGFYQLEVCDRVVAASHARGEARLLGAARVPVPAALDARLQPAADTGPAHEAEGGARRWLALSVGANLALLVAVAALGWRALSERRKG